MRILASARPPVTVVIDLLLHTLPCRSLRRSSRRCRCRNNRRKRNCGTCHEPPCRLPVRSHAFPPDPPATSTDCGFGNSIPLGAPGLITPTEDITATGEELLVDGVRVIFQLTPEIDRSARRDELLLSGQRLAVYGGELFAHIQSCTTWCLFVEPSCDSTR
jgi:hypothetical protein